MRNGYIILLCGLLLVSCSPKVVTLTVPERYEVHDTIYKREVVVREVVRENSVRDSSSTRQRGDTVYIERWHWEKNTERERELMTMIDSLMRHRMDSVPYPVEVSVEVPAQIRGVDKLFMGLGKLSMALMVLLVVWALVRRRW